MVQLITNDTRVGFQRSMQLLKFCTVYIASSFLHVTER